MRWGVGRSGAAAITIKPKAPAEEGTYLKVIINNRIEKCTLPYGNGLQD